MPILVVVADFLTLWLKPKTLQKQGLSVGSFQYSYRLTVSVKWITDKKDTFSLFKWEIVF